MKKYKILGLRYEVGEYKQVVKAIRKITGKRSPNVSGWIKDIISNNIEHVRTDNYWNRKN